MRNPILDGKYFLKMTVQLYQTVFFAAIILCSGCDDELYQYSIHETGSIDGISNYNSASISDIENLSEEYDSDFTFAVITDSHTSYDRLENAVSTIASNPDVRFVIHAGDITDAGLLYEYEDFVSAMKNLSLPYVVAIGNHDLLGNGARIFSDVFGPTDFGFVYNNVFFFVANNNSWESRAIDLDFISALLEGRQNARYRVMITHVPVVNDDEGRFNEEFIKEYEETCSEYNLDLSIHGHTHYYRYIDNYPGGTSIFIADAVSDKRFYLVHVSGSGFEVETYGL